MHESRSRTGRGVLGAVLVILVLLIAAAFVRRSEYPDGSFLRQERTYVEQTHPDIADVLKAVVPGETPAAELVEHLGPPSDKVEKDGLELWVFTTGVRRVVERAILGLIPAGTREEVVESRMPVGVRDGVVVHTYVSQGADAATKQAVESMWDAYLLGK